MTIKRDHQDNIEQLRKPEPPHVEQVVERLPSVAGGISALASATAPFTYFDHVEFFSVDRGAGGVTLSARRSIANIPGQGVVSDRVITCHLRAPLFALLALRDTLNALEKMAVEQAAAAVAAAEAEAMPSGLPH